MSRTVSVNFPAMPMILGKPALTFVRLSGHEALSQLFSYTVELKTPDSRSSGILASGPAANLDLKALLGQECTITLQLDGKGVAFGSAPAGERKISGLITRARIKKAEGRHMVYELVLQPWLWLATRTSDHKIFQEKTVVEILDEVLGDYAFPVEKRCNGEYPLRDYQVQYGESDYDFMQRLMQEWGIYWYFEHAEGQHTLVLCDHSGAHSPLPVGGYETLLYHDASNKLDEEYVTFFDAAESLTSGAWVSSDFDFTRPTADLISMSAQPRDTSHAEAEIFAWPGDYTQAGEGDTLARIRMEERRMRGRRAHGEGNLRGVTTGCTFTLAEHPHLAANEEYLIISADLEIEDVAEETGHQQYRQHVRFEAQPAAEPYRPKRTQAKPHTHGPQTATVTGPSGEGRQEIWTDKYGRIKVQFHWDRYGKRDEKSSCWVRVSHPWAGSNFGMMHIPRIGQEVVVDFLNGDPDCPLVTGRVYNASNMPPWDLPDNATQSGVLTRSSKEGGRDNANALRFEDKKGEEEVWLHAEKDQRIEVENDESHWVGHDRVKNVDNNETTTIGVNRTEAVGVNESIAIGVNRVKVVGVHETDTIGVDWNIVVGAVKMEVVGSTCTQTVGESKSCSVGTTFDTTVGESMSTTVGTDTSFSTGEEHSVSVGKNQSISVGEEQSLSVGKNQSISVSEDRSVSAKNSTETVEKEFLLDAGEKFQITCGDASLIMEKDGTITLQGKDITFKAAGEMGIKADKNITLKGQKIMEN